MIPLEYISLAILIAMSAFGFYAGCRALLARTAAAKRSADHKPGRGVGWMLVTFGSLCIYTALTMEVPEGGSVPWRFFLIPAAACLTAGAACLYIFRRRDV